MTRPARRFICGSLVVLATALFAPIVGIAQVDDDDPWTPAQHARIAAAEATMREMARSNLRFRVLFSQPQLVPKGATWELGPEDELAALVDAARGSTDPIVLGVLAQRCSMPAARAACDPADIARRWVEADAQNQVAWLNLAGSQGSSGRTPAARATFERASRASTFRIDQREAARSMWRALPKDLTVQQRADVMVAAHAKTFWITAIDATSRVSTGCKEESLRDACHRLLATMDRDADDLLTVFMSARLSQRFGVDPALAAQRLQRLDRMRAGFDAVVKPAGDLMDELSDDQAKQVVDHLEALADLGELELSRRALRALGLSADAAVAATREGREARERAEDAERTARGPATPAR